MKYVTPRTSADAIAVGFPTFGFEGLEALRRTKGIGVAVSEDEIRKAVSRLKGMGVSAEMGGAAGFAGFVKLYEKSRWMFNGKSVVVAITGSN